MIRELKLDKDLDKYVLFIENESELKNGDQIVGTQKNSLTQIWDKEHINIIKDQVESQKKENEHKLEQINSEIKSLPKLSDREKQQLTEFKEKLQKVQTLNKLEQLESAKKNHEDALVKIDKDLEELNNAISS